MGINKFCIQCKKGKQMLWQQNETRAERASELETEWRRKKIETNSIYILSTYVRSNFLFREFYFITFAEAAATKFDCVFSIYTEYAVSNDHPPNNPFSCHATSDNVIKTDKNETAANGWIIIWHTERSAFTWFSVKYKYIRVKELMFFPARSWYHHTKCIVPFGFSLLFVQWFFVSPPNMQKWREMLQFPTPHATHELISVSLHLIWINLC